MSTVREVYYNEELAESSNSSGSLAHTHNTLSFNATPGKKYYVFASAIGNINTTSNRMTVALSDNTSVAIFTLLTPHDMTNWHSMHQFLFFDWDTSGGVRSFSVEHKPDSAGLTTKLKSSRLLVVESLNADFTFQGGDEIPNTSLSYVDRGSVTLNPPSNEDYLILAFAHVNLSALSRPLYMRMYDGVSAYREQKIRLLSTLDWQGYAAVFKLSGISSPTTVSIQQRVDSALDTAMIRDVVIIALPLSTFANDYFAEELTRTLTTSTTHVTALSMTQTPAAADHLVFSSAIVDAGANTFANDCLFDDDGVIKLNPIVEPDIGQGNDDESFFYCAKEPYAATSRTWSLKQAKLGSGFGPVGLDDMGIAVLELAVDMVLPPPTIQIRSGIIRGGVIR